MRTTHTSAPLRLTGSRSIVNWVRVVCAHGVGWLTSGKRSLRVNSTLFLQKGVVQVCPNLQQCILDKTSYSPPLLLGPSCHRPLVLILSNTGYNALNVAKGACYDVSYVHEPNNTTRSPYQRDETRGYNYLQMVVPVRLIEY